MKEEVTQEQKNQNRMYENKLDARNQRNVILLF